MMNKRILILTAQKGGGHRSSSDAVEKAILALNQNADIISFDALELMPGYNGDEKGYVLLTTRYRVVWKLFFELTSLFSGVSNFFLHKTIERRFKDIIDRYQPDIILTLHPCFVGSVQMCLKKMRLSIPVLTCIVDLVKHTRLWHDKRSAATFVPTARMRDVLLKKGFKPERVIHTGFPVKEAYLHCIKNLKADGLTPDVLMINPSMRGNKAALMFIRSILAFRVNLTVVTGQNTGMKTYLDKNLKGEPSVTILGYVTDMAERMARADIIITKAGPNLLMEAVAMGVPIIITGHIPGQEEKNHAYIVENHYGLKAESPCLLRDALGLLLKENRRLMRDISENQRRCTDTRGAEAIAAWLSNHTESL